MQVTLQLYTVPGQVHYNSTRQLVLRGADGVVFVADSQRTMARSNVESFKNLEENLLLQGVDLKGFPCVIQFNKRDLRDIMVIDEMDQMVNRYSAPFFEAVATSGVGVQDTLEGIVKLVMRSLRERYEPMVAASGPRAPEMAMPSSPPGVGVPRPPATAVVSAPRLVTPTAPPAGAAAAAGHDPRATTVDLQAATRPPSVLDASPLIAPPPPADEVDLMVDALGPDETPTVVFEPPDLLEGPLGEEGPSDQALADEVTATGFSSEEAVFFGIDEGLELEPLSAGEELELDLEVVPPGGAEPLRRTVFEVAEPSPFAAFEESLGAPVGEVVLERPPEGPAPYEDHVRAPSPFAEVSLERESPFAAEPEPAPEAQDAALAFDRQPFAAVEAEPEVAPQPPAAAEAGAFEPEAIAATVRPAARPATSAVDELLASVMRGRAKPVPPPFAEVVAQAAALAEPPPAPPFPTPAAPAAREPMTLTEGDPFAIEEPEPPPASRVLVASALDAVMPAEAIPYSSAIAVRAKDNQLRVQLQGSGAIAEYGEVREMDIVVPVPGPWIGNRRVTIQLRLTLTPAAEDGDDGAGGSS